MSARRSLSRSAACALAAAAIAAPAAAASPAVDPPAHHSTGGAIDFEAPVPADGFEWSSAAIGAGGVMVLVLMTGAGVSTLRRHHRQSGLAH